MRLVSSRAPSPHLRDDNGHVITVVPAEGPVLDRILYSTHAIWHEGLSRQAYGRYHAAQMRTAGNGTPSQLTRVFERSGNPAKIHM